MNDDRGDHPTYNHPTLCGCGSPVTAEANFPDPPRDPYEAFILARIGGIIVQTFYLCDECVEFAIQVSTEIHELEQISR